MKRTYFKFIVAASVMLGCISVRAAEVQTLVVNNHDGTTIKFALETRPVVEYTNGNLSFTTLQSDVSQTVELSNVKSFTFESNDNPSGIVTVKNAKKSDGVHIYNLNGVQMKSFPVAGDGTCTYNLNGLSQGIYIVIDGNTSYKVVIK